MKFNFRIFCYIVLPLIMLTQEGIAQQKLASLVSMHVKQVKLSAVLDTLGKKHGFYFSYSNDQIRSDSLVDLSVNNQPLRTVLDTLFKGNVDFKESPGYVILRLAPNSLTMDAETQGGKEQNYYISGYVLDEHSGLGIQNASVYEKRLLVSTLTDKKGFFKIKIKGTGMITLTVSKEFYKDASVNFLSDVSISLKPENSTYNIDADSSKVERSWLGRIFISSAQKLQSVNLSGYFATVPFQTSLTPGLSSHGMMSGQVVNHFSFNLLGGYTAGLNGIEFGGLFNISKQDVRYLQVAGLFNVVGGDFSGVQIAALGNSVYKNSDGLQIAGIYNLTKKDSRGFRIAGLANITGDTVKGAQIAGIFNKAKVMEGFSFGLVNIADTLTGYAVGLLNLSHNGYHKIIVNSSETAPVNLGFKTGNHKLYSVLSAGMNFNNADTYYTVGLGLGHDFVLSPRSSISAELSSLTVMSPKWAKTYMINRVSTVMNFNINPSLVFFAGPSFNLFYNEGSAVKSEQEQILKGKPALMNIGRNKGWVGWMVGISIL